MYLKYWKVAAGILLPLLGTPVLAADGATSFVASGTGQVVTKPDIVYVSIGFDSEGKTPELALRSDAKTAAAITKAMTGAGVASSDLQTMNYRISEEQGPDGCGQYHENVATVPCKTVGYEITNSMTVRIRDLDHYGAVLEAAIHAGLTDISNITLAVADPKPYEDKAYAAALLDARHKAELTAATLGFKLGAILDVGANFQRVADDDKPATLANGIVVEPDGYADLGVIIQPGELTFSRQASITYEIVQER